MDWLSPRDIPVPFGGMRFRLTYDGELKAAGNHSNRSKEKWAIRKALHPQLAEFWGSHPGMLRAREMAFIPAIGPFTWSDTHPRQQSTEAPPTPLLPSDDSTIDLFEPRQLSGHTFMPIVRESVALACSLDIIFLRRGDIGSLVAKDGDIDNRIKTLFDGLRMPSADELEIDQPHEQPFFCLLEQDAQITDFAIHTDRLLSRPNAPIHEVRLILEVNVRAMKAATYNMPFWG